MSLSETASKKILGISGRNTSTGNIRADEFLPELRGHKAIRKYQEMRDNDPTIGAVMYAVEQMLRDVKLEVRPSDPEDKIAQQEAKFLEEVLEDMEHTLDDHISEALGYLTFGFSWFEVVYKRRVGPKQKSPKKRSKFTDGRIGVRKIASRAPWTVNKFDVDEVSGEVLGIFQNSYKFGGSNYIPASKSLYYRTTVLNGDASGRSILRNSYTSYERLKTLQQYEAIGIERELAGIPVIELPSEYFSSDPTEDQRAVIESLKEIGRDLKFNDQGFIMHVSDPWMDPDGKPTAHKRMSVRLMASEGTRNIDIRPVVRDYQHDIARSVLAEFMMLGSGQNGSYALSKSKTDIFLRALESYVQSIVDVLNKQLVERLWELNGLDYKYLPKIVAGDVAPHDLKELGAYLRNLNGADISLADHVDIVDALLENAELPKLNREIYEESRVRARQSEAARADYYDGPDDNVVGTSNEDDDEKDTEIGSNAGDS